MRRCEREGHPTPERAQAGHGDVERKGRLGRFHGVGRNGRVLVAGQMVEEGDVGREDVALRRKVRQPEPVEEGLILPPDREREDERLLARWRDLTSRVLPAMAAAASWPIRFDHCFMRVLLDNAFGGVWHAFIKRPAIRHMPPDALARAVGLAEQVVREPALLPELNRRSLGWRRLEPKGRSPV